LVDILSQDEIDALLSAVSTGEVAPEETDKVIKKRSVVPYDFKRPNRVSKDQMRTLQMIHDSFARAVTTSLSSLLRTMVEVNLIAVDQLTYAEFILSLSNPTCINVVGMNPLKGNAVLEMNPALVFAIVDRLLGGKGLAIKETRAMTDIESSVIEKVIMIALRDLKEVWMHILELNFQLVEKETNPQFVQIVAPGEIVILITLEIRVGEGAGVMSLCMPYIVLEPIMTKLSAQHWINASQREERAHSYDLMKDNMDTTLVSLISELGNANLTIQEILELKENDIIRLNTNINDDIVIKIGNRQKYKGFPGINRGNKAVKIRQFIEPQESEEKGKNKNKGENIEDSKK